MQEHREAVITVTEHQGNTRVRVDSDDAIVFTLNFETKHFDDPRTAELQRVVDSQRVEITDALKELHETKAALNEERKAPSLKVGRRISGTKRPRRK